MVRVIREGNSTHRGWRARKKIVPTYKSIQTYGATMSEDLLTLRNHGHAVCSRALGVGCWVLLLPWYESMHSSYVRPQQGQEQ